MAEQNNYLRVTGNSVTLPIWVFGLIISSMFGVLLYNFQKFDKNLEEIQKNQENIRTDIVKLTIKVENLEQQTQANSQQYSNLDLRVLNLEVWRNDKSK
jgi:peptidoglycan hydrolase CwlO-like protein